MSVGHLNHILIVYSSMEHVTIYLVVSTDHRHVTDRQTDGRMIDILSQHSPRYAYASRGNTSFSSQISITHTC